MKTKTGAITYWYKFCHPQRNHQSYDTDTRTQTADMAPATYNITLAILKMMIRSLDEADQRYIQAATIGYTIRSATSVYTLGKTCWQIFGAEV